ncbi:MAG: hypothetical protein AABM64_11220 [Pseudomonadota bacterium]
MDESGQPDRGGPQPLAAAEIMPESVRWIRSRLGFNLLKQEIMHAGNAVLADGTIVDW